MSRALFVTQHYRPELIGSAPFCVDLAEWLARLGWDVTVLTGLPHYPSAELFASYRAQAPRREEVNRVAVERVRNWMPSRGSAKERILGEASFFKSGLWALLTGRVRRSSLVLSLCPSILSVGLGVLARQRGGRHIAIVHDIQSGLAKSLGMVGSSRLLAVMRTVERLFLNRTDLIAVLSAEMRDELRAIGVTRPIEIIPIWVDTDVIFPLVSPAARAITVLYSGNLGKKQGLGQLIGLAEELQRRRPDIEIVLRGSGSQSPAVQAEITARGLTNIRLAELLPREMLGQGLAEGDIHLVPQEPDAAAFAVPSKIYNIMAAGRPFVATALPDSPLWNLQRESGAFLCVPPNDTAAFADAVLALADDRQRRAALGQNGRAFVEAHYAKGKVLGNLATRIDALYA